MRTCRPIRRLPRLAAVLSCLTFGCDGSTGPDSDDLGAANIEDLATFVAGLDATGGAAYGMTSDARTGSHNFNRSAPCPAGGTFSMTGSASSSVDPATRVLSTTWSHTQTHDDCAVTHHRRDGREVTSVLDGTVSVNGTASYQLPQTRGEEREILSYSSRRVGSTTTTVGDRTRTCEIDITQTYDPATGKFTVSGVMCGREVNVTFAPGHRHK
jgi:hypothetical protein